MRAGCVLLRAGQSPPGMQGGDLHTSPRVHTGNKNSVLMHNIRDSLFHHKHKNNSEAGRVLFFYQPRPKDVLNGNACEVEGICEHVKW